MLGSQQEQFQNSRTNEAFLNERETEITHIVKSIHDLNELFKDIATMVVDQVRESNIKNNNNNNNNNCNYIASHTNEISLNNGKKGNRA